MNIRLPPDAVVSISVDDDGSIVVEVDAEAFANSQATKAAQYGLRGGTGFISIGDDDE